jgi:hypothetical protein
VTMQDVLLQSLPLCLLSVGIYGGIVGKLVFFKHLQQMLC